MSTVLITDGEQRAALAAVRSLGRAGHTVIACSVGGHSLAGASRYCQQEFPVASPLTNPEKFVAGVEEIISSRGVGVVLPITEPSLLAILPIAERWEGVRVPFAGIESFLRICDKAEVARLAAEVGIRVPRQDLIDSPEEAGALLSGGSFPLVLKPGRSVVREGSARKKVSVIHVDSAHALQPALARLPAAAFPVLAQERIIGPGIGIFVLLRDGELEAAFAHCRLREKPPSGGVSVLRESVPLDADLLDRCVRLLRRFNWEGVAMVECKLSAATGVPYIMEINGRFWGSLQLAVDAGVDFPRLLLENRDGAPPITQYEVGVRSRWEWGDVDHLIARLRRSPDELSLPPGAPGRARAVVDFLTGFRPKNRPEILRLADPGPFLRETVAWIRGR